MAKISVIIPCYNVEKYLSRCITSLINQTFADWEAICIDDGSPDNCPQLLDEYAAKDSRIKVIHQKNQGQASARENGIASSSGDYIYFLDADDAIHPQCLDICYNLAFNNNVDMISFAFEPITATQEVPTKFINFAKLKTKFSDNPLFNGTYKGKWKICFNIWSKFYKKELLQDVKFIKNNKVEDFPYVFAILAKKPKTISILEKLYFYTYNPQSVTHEKGNRQRIMDYFESVRSIIEIYSRPELKKELAFLKTDFIPNILKQQYNRCCRADAVNSLEMFTVFKDELRYLQDKNLLSWRGHKLCRYLKYKKLLRKP